MTLRPTVVTCFTVRSPLQMSLLLWVLGIRSSTQMSIEDTTTGMKDSLYQASAEESLSRRHWLSLWQDRGHTLLPCCPPTMAGWETQKSQSTTSRAFPHDPIAAFRLITARLSSWTSLSPNLVFLRQCLQKVMCIGPCLQLCFREPFVSGPALALPGTVPPACPLRGQDFSTEARLRGALCKSRGRQDWDLGVFQIPLPLLTQPVLPMFGEYRTH